MSWFRVDDAFIQHPKLEALELNPRQWAYCMAVWIAAGCYAASNNTDGYISSQRLKRLTPLGAKATTAAKRLVEAGLWRAETGGFSFHDWSDYNPTKSELEASRRSSLERQRRWREKKNKHESAESSDKTEGVDALQDALVDRHVTQGVRRVTNAPPTRPVKLTTHPPTPHGSKTVEAKKPVTQVGGGGSLQGLPDPMDKTRTVSSEEFVLRLWARESLAVGVHATSSTLGRDRSRFMELERLALEASPAVAEAQNAKPEEAFCGLLAEVIRRAAAHYTEQSERRKAGQPAERFDWRPGWVVSRWEHFSRGLVHGFAA